MTRGPLDAVDMRGVQPHPTRPVTATSCAADPGHASSITCMHSLWPSSAAARNAAVRSCGRKSDAAGGSSRNASTSWRPMSAACTGTGRRSCTAALSTSARRWSADGCSSAIEPERRRHYACMDVRVTNRLGCT